MELKKGRNADSGVDYYSVSKTLSKYVQKMLWQIMLENKIIKMVKRK